MEHKERIVFRGEKGRFIKNPEMGEVVVERPRTSPSVTSEQTITERLSVIRTELNNIEEAIKEPTTPIEISLPNIEKGGVEMGILGDKLLKRKQKEVKEKSPRQFSEMLVVANDTQLLKECDQEALGAFIKYIDHNKDRITHLVLNGDIADFSAQSFFDKDLNTMNSANDEIESVRWFIDTLSEKLPNAKKVFLDGNHEARWKNMIDTEKGNEAWIKSIDEQFGLEGWEHIPYGSGGKYEWHDRIFWHGHRSSIHVAKSELQDAGMSVTTAHINRNQFFETTDARGERKSALTHGGFSKDNLGFMKKANTGWSQGFGVYYWDDKTKTEQAYMVTMQHRKPVFISPEGDIFDGTGFEIPGFEKPKGRGRPRGTKK